MSSAIAVAAVLSEVGGGTVVRRINIMKRVKHQPSTHSGLTEGASSISDYPQ